MNKLSFFLLPMVLLALFPRISISQMREADIVAIQEAIKARGLSWVAEANDITRMTDVEREALLGALPPPSDAPQSPRPGIEQKLNLPSYFNWGNKDGHNWLTSVKNQANCGSCWAFSTSGAFEAKQKIRSNDFSISPNVSEQSMISCWKGDCGDAVIDWALDQFQNAGAPDESCFPYVSGVAGIVPPCSNRCSDWALRTYYVDVHGRYDYPSVNTMKNEIMTYGPITVGMLVYTDFFPYSGGVYEHLSGGYEGGHAVVLYGWDDASNCWLAKNSWGTSWGEGGPDGSRGWFRIKMGSNESDCEHLVYYLQPRGMWYASPSGNDGSGNGSQSTPFATIQHTVNAAHDGDTIMIMSGTYYENVNCTKSLTIMGQNRENTIIDGGGGPSGIYIYIAAGGLGKISELKIRNCQYAIRLPAAPTGNWTIENNVLENNSIFGVRVDDFDSVRIERNIIANNGGGISATLESLGFKIYHNIIRQNTGPGIFVFSSSSVDVQNNIVVENATGVNINIPGNFLDYNNVWGNTGSNYSACSPGAHDISGDPMFVGGMPFDYHLRSCSPCVDAGNPTFANDPDGTKADMGVYYFNQTGFTCIDSDHDCYGDPGHPENNCQVDNCPTVYNPDQEDTDVDGIGNACEGTSFQVTNKADAGAGSLRNAINAANFTPNPDTIIFTISDIIRLASELPAMKDDSIIILGSTAPGGAHSVIIDGAGLTTCDGLVIQSSNNKIEGLTIRSFPGNGITVDSPLSVNNTFTNNLVYNNTGLAIDLNNDGVTPNDPGDADTGPNNLMNYPEIDSVFMNPDSTFTVYGRTINNGIIELFVAHPIGQVTKPADPSGHGEAYSFIGSDTCDASGNFSYIISKSVGQFSVITATATDTLGNTSEFCQNYTLTPGPLIIIAYSRVHKRSLHSTGFGKDAPPSDNWVNLKVSDSLGFFIGKDPYGNLSQTLFPASYNDDATGIDSITIPRPILGEFMIEVVAQDSVQPPADTTLKPTYTIGVRIDGTDQAILILNSNIPASGVVDTFYYNVEEGYHFINGDANGSDIINALDVTYLINDLYKHGPKPYPLVSGDANCNGITNILDITYLINYLYKHGPAPCQM